MTSNPIDHITPQPFPLRRPYERRLLAGVAAGIAEHLAVDVSVVRVGIVVLTLLGGLGLPLYVAGWLLIPEEGAPESLAEEWLHQYRQRVA